MYAAQVTHSLSKTTDSYSHSQMSQYGRIDLRSPWCVVGGGLSDMACLGQSSVSWRSNMSQMSQNKRGAGRDRTPGLEDTVHKSCDKHGCGFTTTKVGPPSALPNVSNVKGSKSHRSTMLPQMWAITLNWCKTTCYINQSRIKAEFGLRCLIKWSFQFGAFFLTKHPLQYSTFGI